MLVGYVATSLRRVRFASTVPRYRCVTLSSVGVCVVYSDDTSITATESGPHDSTGNTCRIAA